jgi:hypothetical protein
VATIAEQYEKAKRDGSPDDGRHDAAAPTGGPPYAHAPGMCPAAVMPAPRSHVEDFFGCRTTAQSQTGSPREEAGPAGRVSTPRARCQRHPLFEERLPYDLSDARLQLVLTMLTSSLCSKANVQGVGSRHGGAPIHKSSMKRSMSDQSLHIQGRQPVNQDNVHRCMRRSGSEASLSTNLKGPPSISQHSAAVTPKHVAFDHLSNMRDSLFPGARTIDRDGNFVGSRHRLEVGGPGPAPGQEDQELHVRDASKPPPRVTSLSGPSNVLLDLTESKAMIRT